MFEQVKPTFLFGFVDEDWRQYAKCAGLPIELFFAPEQMDGRKLPRTYYNEAKKVCQTCPVINQCLERGMDEEYGVWGGLTKAERRHIKKQPVGIVIPMPRHERPIVEPGYRSPISGERKIG